MKVTSFGSPQGVMLRDRALDQCVCNGEYGHPPEEHVSLEEQGNVWRCDRCGKLWVGKVRPSMLDAVPHLAIKYKPMRWPRTLLWRNKKKDFVEDDFMLRTCTFKIEWGDEDREWIADCDEYPSLSFMDPDMLVALAGIRDLVRDAIDDEDRAASHG